MKLHITKKKAIIISIAFVAGILLAFNSGRQYQSYKDAVNLVENLSIECFSEYNTNTKKSTLGETFQNK